MIREIVEVLDRFNISKSIIIEKLREELEDLNVKIVHNPSIQKPSKEVLVKFVENQLYIIPHDLKALSHALSKARVLDEVE